MTPDDFKLALLSALESEHIGTLEEIDRRLRARKILIQGYRIDPIIGYVAVKIDVLREIRPPDEVKSLAEKGSVPLLEDIFAGLPGYVVVTDAQLRIEDFGVQRDDAPESHVSIQCTMNIEHTYIMKDGKYLCEWGDPKNPLHTPKGLFEKRKPVRSIEQNEQGTTIKYEL